MRFQTGLLLGLFLCGLAPVHAQEAFSRDRLPPFVHPPVLAPVPDGIKLNVPPELGNRKLARLGLVDMTAAPFHADPTGERDSTMALQQAIDFARDAQMICFFPHGSYLVSDTLLLRHGIHMRSHRAAFMNNRLMLCVLWGACSIDDQVNLGKDKPYYNGHSVHRNIKSYLPLVHVPASGRSLSVPYSERPVLYRWNE